ncbi:MAG: Smr/MutS family protein [Flavobacteriales bacterium]|nr:Smr/MutS family protein [Flavobacteriales bacterium]
MSLEFHIKDRVRFLNEAGEGTITGFPSPGMVMVKDESGFEYPHPVSELVPISDRRNEELAYDKVKPEISDLIERNIDARLAKAAEDEFKVMYNNRKATTDRRKGEIMEVDLHIHELVDAHEGLTNYEMVQIQLEHFERMLRIAEERKIPRCVFIHGVGQGVLRAEIRKMLNSYYPNATFMDAPYNEYGYGATEVRLIFGGGRMGF